MSGVLIETDSVAICAISRPADEHGAIDDAGSARGA